MGHPVQASGLHRGNPRNTLDIADRAAGLRQGFQHLQEASGVIVSAGSLGPDVSLTFSCGAGLLTAQLLREGLRTRGADVLEPLPIFRSSSRNRVCFCSVFRE